MELCHLESIGLPIQRLNGAGLNGAGQAKAPQVKPAALNGAKSDREMKPQNALQQPAAHATRPLYMDARVCWCGGFSRSFDVLNFLKFHK